MENWQIILVTLAAVLVGALVPAIIQLQMTLRNFNRAIEQNALLLKRTLEQAEEVASRANQVTSLMGTMGAVIAPAIALAVTAFKSNGAVQIVEKEES